MRVHDFHRHFGSGPPGSKIHDGKKIFSSEKLRIVGLCAKHEQPIDIRRSDFSEPVGSEGGKPRATSNMIVDNNTVLYENDTVYTIVSV